MSYKIELDAVQQQQIINRLISDYKFSDYGDTLQEGECPGCIKSGKKRYKRLHTYKNNLITIHCSSSNCGFSAKTFELYPDIFKKSIEERFPATADNIHRPALEYVASVRDIDRDVFMLKQKVKENGKVKEVDYSLVTYATVENKGCARLEGVVNGKPFFYVRSMGANFENGGKGKNERGSKYGGYWCHHPLDNPAGAAKIYLVEGIFDAWALKSSRSALKGACVVSLLSCGNFPKEDLQQIIELKKQTGQEKPELVWMLDANASAKAVEFHRSAQKLGFKSSIIAPPATADWNDLLFKNQLTDEHFKNYIYRGRLLAATSAKEKGKLIHEFTGRDEFYFDFDFKYYWHSTTTLKGADDDAPTEESVVTLIADLIFKVTDVSRSILTHENSFSFVFIKKDTQTTQFY